MIEDILNLADETANMMRGMVLDPTIPKHAKDALNHRIYLIESCVNAHLHTESRIIFIDDENTYY